MKQPETSRCYSFLVLNGHKECERTLEVYTRGSSFWFNFWLNVLGGINQDILAASPLSTYSNKKRKKKYEEDGKEGIDHHAILFSCWFSLESKDCAPIEHIISSNEVIDKFHEYLGRDCAPKLLDALKSQAEAIKDREEAVWVDRREAYGHWNQRYGLTTQDLRVIFHDPGFFLQEAHDVAGHSYMRS